ncbi:uncharacterized protein LOC131046435 [Cryptomeria japonica]|uniref:uncharacterized protein LOC131046435 n=1 Tax=Cryptomeria japonica TaxID=3369 RepID=UPI0027DA47F4|nr:uncharacterized protein LOC131046435 [Cryptomeria japonica]
MEEPQQSKVRLKFKRFLFNGGPLMPQGYRLATVEEIGKNIDISKKWELPVKKISPFYEERRGKIRLLDGWMNDDCNALHDTADKDCIWNAVVKGKKWDGSAKKWQNCSDFYSSDGNSLRKKLYDGINLSPQGIKVAWLHAYYYEDVELLYWLWRTSSHPIPSDSFTSIDDSIPLRKIVRQLTSPGRELQMTDEREETEAVLRNASDQSIDGAGLPYVYGPTWGVATVELAIEIYGQAFKETASIIAFENAKCVPITTKLLALFPDQLLNNINNLQLPVAEVFVEAVKRGYTELVNGLLNSGIVELPDAVGEEEKTLFHYALPHGPVFSLLAKTYDKSFEDIIIRQDILGRNVLHWAAKRGYDSGIVDCLPRRFTLRERLINSKDHQRRTPWHIVAYKGDIGMMEKLLPHIGSRDSPKRINYIRATDSFGKTALHLAASEGHADLVRMLVDEGSCLLKERDGQRKTALHHAAQVKIPKAGRATCEALLEHANLTSSERSLLLWASATGIGTADEMEDVPDDVKNYLQTKKLEDTEHLLRAAAVNNNVEMAWEILSRGASIKDIHDTAWSSRLQSQKEKESVEDVLSQLEHIKEQGRDQPSMEDKLGRYVFAQGLAALFLNRFIESPITVGISGEWGMGKSSLMIQTEKILLITAAQLTFPNLLPPEQFVGVKKISLSTRGRKIYQQINRGVHNLLDLSKNESKNQNPLATLLKEYQHRYHDIYKALACMDNNQMLQSSSVSQQQEQEHAMREVPRILTIRYNAWHYRDQNEAWAGLGVTISKEIEKAMTRAQWMSTCWRYTWARQNVNIWFQVILPSLLSISLALWVVLIVWILLKQTKFHALMYGSLPLTFVASLWVVFKSVISVVKPVSKQMLGYVTSPNHTDHLGYQEDVINDINFLKKELGKQPHWFFSFILGLWCGNWFGLCPDNIENTSIPKFMPAFGHDIRIVTFVDDLDRCEEKVILQVLSAINLVLAECKINIILGMDKKMIERAITRNFQVAGDDLAEKFIRKIIQIPLSLPDPTDQESNSFLEYHLRHKIPPKYREKKSVSKSQRGLVVPLEPPAEINGARREAENDARVLNIHPCDELTRRCRGIVEKTVDWLMKLRQPYDESLNSLRSAEGVKLIREILLPNYTQEEAYLFYELRNFTTGNQKLPREWKCLLSYHKFAWYVLSLIGNVYSLPTWKVELVGWVFVCWQWKYEMNHLIKVWYTIAVEQDNGRNRRRSHGPSLSELVTSCMSQLTNSEGNVNKKGFNKNNKNVNKQGISQKNLSKLQEALKIQDVSMEGIQLFQQFRLHCEIDHLPWPSR